MRADVEQDLKNSARRFELHWPSICQAAGCTRDLISVEHPVESIGEMRILDLSAGIDYLATTETGGIRSISARVQQTPHLYSSFTIRLRRYTGSPTEWVKRAKAFQNHEMLSELTIQLYVDKQENLVGYGIVQTRDLIEYLLTGPPLPGYRYTIKDVHDGNSMMVVWWLWMRREGLSVKTSGESKLLGPKEPWSCPPIHAPCLRCNHQIACHVGGRTGVGWAIYDRIWNDASGYCSVKGCTCPAAYHPVGAAPCSTEDA